MTVCAQYGNPRSFYGNIQLGAAPLPLQVYGAWPEERPAQQGMLVSDWQDAPEVVHDYAAEIAARIATIKSLKGDIERQLDAQERNRLRGLMAAERDAKERAFKLKALVEEEESLFILLH
jgi:hypothetical protein